jgi:Domain of unknown function (DUF4337)
MSEDGFHVHGPHDHHVEHAAQSGDSFGAKIAVITAILSTVGALFSYQGGATQNSAMLHKNEASIRKTEASNKWNYYQAKSNKQNLAELALDLASDEKKSFYQSEIARYKKEKEQIKKEAEKLEKSVEESELSSDEDMHLHHRWAQAMTVIQVAISLSAITLLTRQRWLEYLSYCLAVSSFVIGIIALLHR